MPTKQLYSIVLPTQAQQSAGSTVRKNLHQQGVQGSDVAAVQQRSTQPGERTLNGRFGGRFAELFASGLEELSNASGYEAVPFFVQDRENPRPDDGYYSLSSFNINPQDPRGEYVPWNFDGTLIQKGSRRSHWRAVRTTPTDVTNPWGDIVMAQVAIPKSATKVKWYDEPSGTLQTTPPQNTVSGEKIEMNIYDAMNAPGDNPILLYEVPYEDEYPGDMRVWDDYNRPKEYVQEGSGGAIVGQSTVGSATVGEGQQVVVPSQWQRVFRTDHEFRGKPVIESGRLRLVPDETNQTLRAYQWIPEDGRYTLMQMGQGDWRLHDFDLREISPEHVTAIITLEDITNGDLYSVQMTLQRGFDKAQLIKRKNADPVPDGVIQRLDPIAGESDKTPSASQELMVKSEVVP